MPLSVHKGSLKSLIRYEYIVVNPEDWKGNIVVRATTQYKHMHLDIFDNRKWYYSITADRLQVFWTEYTMIDHEAFSRAVADKDTMEYPIVYHLKTSTFYSLFKMHECIRSPPEKKYQALSATWNQLAG